MSGAKHRDHNKNNRNNNKTGQADQMKQEEQISRNDQEDQEEKEAVAAEETVEADPNAEETTAAEIEEIKEFVVSSEKTRSERKKAEQASISAIAAWSTRQKSIAVLALFSAVALIYILIGIVACDINPVVVCVILLIQVAIGVLLDQNPIWLHACVSAASVIAGICVGQVLLMVSAVVVYVASIAALEVLQRMGMLGRA
ncbi:MAG: hypothetical protein ACI4EC_00225 [Lachnospiraceae bacterium]